MANINTPISGSATNTQAEDTVQNPVITTGATGTQLAFITLRFQGIDVDPNVIYDMVNTAYGTVASVKGTLARRTYIFNIEA